MEQGRSASLPAHRSLWTNQNSRYSLDDQHLSPAIGVERIKSSADPGVAVDEKE